MAGVGVLTEVDWLRERSTGLRQHLKAFAVQRGLRRQRDREVEQHDFFEADGRRTAIHHADAAERSVAVAYELDRFRVRAIHPQRAARRVGTPSASVRPSRNDRERRDSLDELST